MKEKNDNQEQQQTRRRFLWRFVGVGGGIFAALATAAEVKKNLKDVLEIPTLWEPLEQARRIFMDQTGITDERRKLLSELFGFASKTYLRAGDDHLYHSSAPRYGKKLLPYPHDFAPATAYSTLFSTKISNISDDFIERKLRSVESLVCSGSPVSNYRTGLYLPIKAEKKEDQKQLGKFRLRVDAESLPYHFLYGGDEIINVKSSMNPGKTKPKRTHGLLISKDGAKKREIWRPDGFVDSKSWLARDFLLITKLPRTRSGGGILLITGGHGAGTQAFELLFNPDVVPTQALYDLKRKLGGEKYFQVVFEATIGHDANCTLATALELSKSLPPQIIKFKENLLKT